jgi:hypothetical protein
MMKVDVGEVDKLKSFEWYSNIIEIFGTIDNKDKYATVLSTMQSVMAYMIFNHAGSSEAGYAQFMVFCAQLGDMTKTLYDNVEVPKESIH